MFHENFELARNQISENNSENKVLTHYSEFTVVPWKLIFLCPEIISTNYLQIAEVGKLFKRKQFGQKKTCLFSTPMREPLNSYYNRKLIKPLSNILKQNNKSHLYADSRALARTIFKVKRHWIMKQFEKRLHNTEKLEI